MQVKDHEDQSLQVLAALNCIQRGGVIKAITKICAVVSFLFWLGGGIYKRPYIVKDGCVPSVANWHPMTLNSSLE